jgi:hypothetical protein
MTQIIVLKMHKICQFYATILFHFDKVYKRYMKWEYGNMGNFTKFKSDLYKGKSLESREIKGIYNLDYLRELQ